MRRAFVLIVLAVAPLFVFCSAYDAGDESEEAPPRGDDAASDSLASGPNDGGSIEEGTAPAVRCTSSQFTRSQHVASISSPRGEIGLWLSDDETEAYFGSTFDHVSKQDATTLSRMYRAKRASRGQSFGEIVEVPLGLINRDVGTATLTQDRLTIIFTSAPFANFNFDIFRATRASPSAPFEQAGALATLNDPNALDLTPFVSDKGDELFFVSSRNGAPFRIYHARAQQGGFAQPAELDVVPGRSLFNPVLSHDGRTLYFAGTVVADFSDRKVYRAHRPSVTETFGPALDVPELTGTGISPVWLSRDECRLYVAEERPTGLGSLDYYVYERDP